MKILIEESVLRQALEAIGAALSDDKPYLNKCRSSYAAIESALDAAEKVEPVAWIVPEFGFLFPTNDAATSYLRNIESGGIPTPLYTHPAPAVPKVGADKTGEV